MMDKFQEIKRETMDQIHNPIYPYNDPCDEPFDLVDYKCLCCGEVAEWEAGVGEDVNEKEIEQFHTCKGSEKELRENEKYNITEQIWKIDKQINKKKRELKKLSIPWKEDGQIKNWKEKQKKLWDEWRKIPQDKNLIIQ